MQNLDRIPCKNRRDRKKLLQLTQKHTHRPDKAPNCIQRQ